MIAISCFHDRIIVNLWFNSDKQVDLKSYFGYILKAQGISLMIQFHIWGSKGFDRGFAAGEAIRMQCVKWQK